MAYKIYSNDPCPCGSGKKYKHCCGKVAFSNEDLKENFMECVGFLISSANAYDKGAKSEAKRMSVEIRKLVHQTRLSQSILSLLGKENVLWFSSVTDEMEEDNPFWIGIAEYVIHIEQYTGVLKYGECAPKFGNFANDSDLKEFSEWWKEEVFVDISHKSYSRSEIVLEMANKDNGAHVDPEVGKEYYETTRKTGIGMKVSQGNVSYDGKDVMNAIVRQIAHEMIFSFSRIEEFKHIKSIKDYVKNY